ncbi:nitrate/nitrite transporter [Naasia sp. SYSU D00948]|uniref:MFS transporter n=1 Tax=Naasia sp. SYSU D00948 TaxID=2817379 RepID=UPI001B303E84|nr:MFS transporter [Naasia sp. SYSU D00948]
MNSRRSWIIFSAGVFAYLVAITQRSSLGVAAVDASERFGSSAAALSTLGVLQLLVYAGMQVPVGILIDRLGPKPLMLAGLALMTVGQTVVAFAPALELAVVGRVLVGAGDAAIFPSVLRLTNAWFSGRKVPQLNQWVGNLGQFGQVLSAIPFAAVLHEAGWVPAFLSAAALSVLSLVVCIAVVSSGDASSPHAQRAASLKEALRLFRASLRRPGTWLGFWAHFVTQSPGVVFALMWGYPFMVFGVGLDPAFASAMLTLMVLTGLVVGPILGLLTVRHPLRRSNLALGVLVLMTIAWGAVLLWPGPVPAWLVVILVISLGIGGPASQIGFDFARTFNPPRRLGSANGIVNVGGFTASFTIMLLIGLVLDAQSRGGALYSFEAFRVAELVQIPVLAIGVVGLLLARHRTRRLLEEEEGIQVGPLWVALARAWGRRRARRTAGGQAGAAS